MKRWLPVLLGVAILTLSAPGADAQVRRNQGGSINWAPYPAVYRVVAVDDYDRAISLSSGRSSTAVAHVPEWVFDLCLLSPGDLIRVDFFVREPDDPPLRAATIWPVALSGENRCKRAGPAESQAAAPEVPPAAVRPADVVPGTAAPSSPLF
jgi:hypothetical protein